MSFHVTIFENTYDNSTNKNVEFSTWNDFVLFIKKLSTVSYASKKDAPLISSAIYKSEESTRKNDNVLKWSQWIAIDIDSLQISFSKLKSVLFEKYEKYDFICHSTASSTEIHAKFRLIFHLSSEIPASLIKRFWYAINKELDNMIDQQTKDLSRMFYVPGQYTNAFNFIFVNSGEPIDPQELMNKHKPLEIKSANKSIKERTHSKLLRYKLSKSSSPKTWNHYSNCPFVNQKLVNEYKSIANIDNSGRYLMIYKIMTSIASTAFLKGYNITNLEIESIIRDIDAETGNRYEKRNIALEAQRAIEFAMKSQF